MRYSYDVPKAYSATHGLRWSDDMAAQADAMFAELSLTQAQVDRLTCHHAWTVNHLFNPKAYSWLGRIALAARFLFGIGVK